MVVGYKLEDGREVTQGGKYKNAQAKGKPIMNEQEFEQFMKDRLRNPDYTLAKKLDLAPIVEAEETEVANKDSSSKEQQKFDLWTDRYKPRQVTDLVGNAGAIAQLYEWLKDWDEVCIRGNKKPLPFRRGMSW